MFHLTVLLTNIDDFLVCQVILQVSIQTLKPLLHHVNENYVQYLGDSMENKFLTII